MKTEGDHADILTAGVLLVVGITVVCTRAFQAYRSSNAYVDSQLPLLPGGATSTESSSLSGDTACALFNSSFLCD